MVSEKKKKKFCGHYDIGLGLRFCENIAETDPEISIFDNNLINTLPLYGLG